MFADDDPFSKASGAADPFGGDYDPFKDQGFKDADKFSWEDEPDPFNTMPEESSESAVKMPLDNAPKTDPFGFSMSEDDTNANLSTEFFSVDQFNANFDNNKDKLETSQNTRSKSVIGDPFASQVKETIPVRAKTSLGERRLADFDFDPFSSSKVSNAEKSKWKSNEDLLNENFGLNRNEGGWGSNNLAPTSKTSSPFNNSFLNQSQQSASEEEQLAWAAKESIKFEEFRKQQEEQERADLELALTLSRSMTTSKSQTSRSPSTGL